MGDSDGRKSGNGEGGPEGDWDARLLNEVDEGLGHLQDKLSGLRQQILSPLEKVERLAREQKQFSRRLEESVHKGRALIYLALGAAVLSLVLSGLVTGMAFHLQGTAGRLQEKTADLEEEVSALRRDMPTADLDEFRDALAAGEKKAEVLKDRVERLQQKQESMEGPVAQTRTLVTDLSARLEGVQEKMEAMKEREKRPPHAQQNPSWSVNLASFAKEGDAHRLARAFSSRGVSADMKPVTVKGQTWFRLYVAGFQNQEAAEAYARRVEKDLQLGSVWISKN